MSPAARLPVVLVPIVLAVATLVGCGQPTAPEVTFSADGGSARTGPIRYCDIQLTECENNDSAVAVLGIPAGRPVQISVPEPIATTPWQVVFRYRAGGQPVEGRSQVFAPGRQRDYTLQVPDGATLETIEIQQYGAPELVGGEPTFRIRASWVLAVR